MEQELREKLKDCTVSELQDILDMALRTGDIVQAVEDFIADTDDFNDKVMDILNEIHDILISKNKKYGNSALNPSRVFSKSNAYEQILVRIDDKLSRIKNRNDDEDEDVITDLIGYLVLLKIAKGK